MKAIAIWDIDGMLKHYSKAPEMARGVETKFETLFRFMHDNKLLTKSIVDSAGKLTTRELFRKDLTTLGNRFAETYEVKYLKSQSSTDPVKGQKLLERYLQELRAKRKRRS